MRKLRLSVTVLAAVLFLICFADTFYVFGTGEAATGELLLTLSYAAIAVISVIFFHRGGTYGVSYYVCFAVACIIMPIALWLYIIIDYAINGGEFFTASGWILIVASLIAAAMTAINIVCAIKTKNEYC